jgi:hypothetical protein
MTLVGFFNSGGRMGSNYSYLVIIVHSFEQVIP